MHAAITILILGIGATAFTDLYACARQRLLGVPFPNYPLVGRWLLGLARADSRQRPVAAGPARRGEACVGWVAHYLIGIGFAAVLPAIAGAAWLQEPTLLPALAWGVATVAAPFLVLQPAMGAGIAASRTARPWAARLHSVCLHAAFGVGLFVSAITLQQLAARV